MKLAKKSDLDAVNTRVSVLGGRPIHAELPPYNMVSGSTENQSTALQAAVDAAALNGGEVHVPGVYKAAYTHKPRVTLVGNAHRQNNSVAGGPLGSRLIAPSNAAPLVTLNDGGGYTEMMAGGIKGMVLEGGQDSIYMPRGAISFDIHDVECSGPVRAGIYAKGFLQEVSVKRWESVMGQYGFYMPDDAAPSGSIWRFDKCDFDDIYWHGQTINGCYVKTPSGASSTGVTWRQIRPTYIVQHGMRIMGGITQWQFDTVMNEGNGYGSAVRTYSDMIFEVAAATLPHSCVLNNVSAGFETGVNLLLRGLDLAGAYDMTFNGGVSGTRPVYDPTGANVFQGAHNFIFETVAGYPEVLVAGSSSRPGHRVWRGTAAPGLGVYVVGDRVENTAPVAGGAIGWVCTTAGTPGTWKAYGAIAS